MAALNPTAPAIRATRRLQRLTIDASVPAGVMASLPSAAMRIRNKATLTLRVRDNVVNRIRHHGISPCCWQRKQLSVPVDCLGDQRGNHAQQGRFWKEFAGNADLAVAVLDALRNVAADTAPLRWEPVTSEPVIGWRADRQALIDRSAMYIPVLEAHLAAVTSGPLLPVSALQTLASRLGRTGRDAGLFTEGASLSLDSDADTAWATSTSGEADRSWNEVYRGGPRGMAADRNGSVLIYVSLPRDMLGTLVSQPYLAEQLDLLLRTGYEVLPSDVKEIAPAAGLEPVDRVIEGDPADIGHRSSSTLRMAGSKPVRTTPDVKVAAAALPRAIPEIARELAARLMAELRTRR
jgi:hypothetical protein